MTDVENIKNAIKTAIQMEKDGHSFYKKAAAQTTSEISKSEWNQLVNSSKKYADMPIFPKDLKAVEGTNPDTNELDALRMGMDSEKEAIDYYTTLKENSTIEADADLDCVGFYCPMPIAMTKEEIDKIKIGKVLKVEADDPAAEEDIKRWAKHTGHEILKFEKEGAIMTFYIKKMK